MGKYRNGVRVWWHGLIEAVYEGITVLLESVIKPKLSRFFAEAMSIMNRARTDREFEAILVWLCWAWLAAAVAARLSLLFEFLLGVGAGVTVIAAWAVMMRRRSRQRLATVAEVDLLGASSRAEPSEYERVEWVNKLLRKAWPSVTSAMEDARPDFRDVLEPMLETHRWGMYKVIREKPDVQRIERYVPVDEVISAIYFNDISLGNIAPTIQGLKLSKLKDGKVTIFLRVAWQSDCKITLGVGTASGILPFVLENLKIRATARATLHITESPGFVGAVVAYVPREQKPIFDFDLKAIEAPITFMSNRNVKKRLHHYFSDIILDSLLWPHRLVCYNVLPKELDPSQLYLKLHGQLSVVIMKGFRLVNLYPYVVMYCRPRFKLRTTSIENTHNPFWNEVFTLDVEDKQSQSLVLQIMNEDKGADEFVGIVTYPLKDLVLDKDVELELPIHPRKAKSRHAAVDGEKRPYGWLQVELRYHVYTDEEREAAMKSEGMFEEALATPQETESYTTAIDMIHPY